MDHKVRTSRCTEQEVRTQLCPNCGVTETMNHIITQKAYHPDLYGHSNEKCGHRPNLWPEITLRTIMGCEHYPRSPQITETPENASENDPPHPKGARRLLQILIPEAAYLIWVLRCERCTNGRTHTTRKIKSRWFLKREMDLPPDWLPSREVLVGKEAALGT
ncbi:hypothetical protein F5148DRAFT_706732 [Russula earlei]|uniref:Uncharacterized protein n=1 Tax=Russula earlei TaxID=71964 RepID=A0ACC0UDA2_9AGAM|nr:hypothetical protein F5148DRAFT_706732 [Russula earlei]